MTDQNRSIARRDVIMTAGLGLGAGLAAGLVPAAATAQRSSNTAIRCRPAPIST
jgi:hypothetical protein